jgi:hypothetical protein
MRVQYIVCVVLLHLRVLCEALPQNPDALCVRNENQPPPIVAAHRRNAGELPCNPGISRIRKVHDPDRLRGGRRGRARCRSGRCAGYQSRGSRDYGKAVGSTGRIGDISEYGRRAGIGHIDQSDAFARLALGVKIIAAVVLCGEESVNGPVCQRYMTDHLDLIVRSGRRGIWRFILSLDGRRKYQCQSGQKGSASYTIAKSSNMILIHV